VRLGVSSGSVRFRTDRERPLMAATGLSCDQFTDHADSDNPCTFKDLKLCSDD